MEITDDLAKAYAEIAKAGCRGDIERFRDYRNYGVDILRLPERLGFLPLLYHVAGSGQVEILKELLALGVGDIHYINKKQNLNLLSHAARSGGAEAVRFLLEQGADPHVVSADGLDAIELAERKGHSQVLAVFEESGYTLPLFRFAQRGDIPGQIAAIAEGVEFRRKNGSTWSPLSALVYQGYVDFALRLIGAGVDPNGEGRDHETSLDIAVRLEDVDLARRLLDAGASVDYPGSGDYTPLMGAAQEGSLEIMELLLSRGANIDAFDECHATALHHAVDGNRIDAVRLLLERGADPLIGTVEGSRPAEPITPEQQARKWGFIEIADLIASYSRSG